MMHLRGQFGDWKTTSVLTADGLAGSEKETPGEEGTCISEGLSHTLTFQFWWGKWGEPRAGGRYHVLLHNIRSCTALHRPALFLCESHRN